MLYTITNWKKQERGWIKRLDWKEFVGLKAKISSCLMDDGTEIKKIKRIKTCVIETKIRHQNLKNCVLNNEIISKSQQIFKTEAHTVYTEEVNKIALSDNDDKRLLAYDGVTTHPYGYNTGKVCKTKILSKVYINDQF